MYHRPQGLSFAAALRDLQESKAAVRVAAAEALGRASSEEERDQAFAALSPAVGDARPEVRTCACLALAELQRPEAWEVIALCLSDEVPEVRQSAAIALGTLGAPASFDILAQTLKEGAADLRFQVATSLAEVDLQRCYEPLLAALDDPDPQVLGAVALSLGATGNAACTDALAKLLDHASSQTRLDAAYALAQLGDPRSREILAAALSHAEGGWDAAVALEALGGSSIPALEEFLASGAGDVPVRLRAAGALLALSQEAQPTAQRCLLLGLDSRKLEFRGLALQQIELHGGDWAVPALRKLHASFRGRSMRDEIDQTLRALSERSEQGSPA